MTDFRCPFCSFHSANEQDARLRYCGYCHVFVDDVLTASPAMRKAVVDFAHELCSRNPSDVENLQRIAYVWEHRKAVSTATD